MALPLEGMKIVDFGIWIAGPFVGRLLSDLGASVIKVEPPEGETRRPRSDQFTANTQMLYVTRGRNLAVDLKHPEGLAIVQKLVADADIVSQNLRVGVAQRLGIGYEDVRKINPDVIYLSSTGYGDHGPRAQLASFEPLNSAFVGQHYRSGGEGNPPSQSISLDAFCALIGACGAMMAVVHRDQTGEGQYLDVSQLACAMYYTSDTFLLPDGSLGPLPKLDKGQHGMGPLDRLYETSEGWIVICCEKQGEWDSLCGALGRTDLQSDPRFRTITDRKVNALALGSILEEVFRSRTAEQWFTALDSAGAPCEIPVAGGYPGLTNQDYFDWGLLTEHQHPIWGRVVEPRVVPRFSESDTRHVFPTPWLGEHTREILGELGYTRSQIEDLVRQKVVTAPAVEPVTAG